MAIMLNLPEELDGVHDTFHVSNLKKCLADPTLQVPLDEIQVDAKLNFVEEHVEILKRCFKKLKRSTISIIKNKYRVDSGAGDLGVATLRALVYAGVMTSTGSDEYVYSVCMERMGTPTQCDMLCDTFVFSLLLTPLCCDDAYDATPHVSALAGCDRLVSEPMVIENYVSPTRKKFRWGIAIPTGLKRYTDPAIGLKMKRTNRKCRIPIDLYPFRVEEKLTVREVEGKWIMKKEMTMISKDGTISGFPGYTSSKEEEDEEEDEKEEEKEESEKKRLKEASEIGSNSESPGYAEIDNEVESDLESTARSEPKCKEIEDTYLVKLWDLVKERFSTTEPTDDKEKELWVELKRLFEPDYDDTLWKLQRLVEKEIHYKNL
ncbi:hypothetical protein Tco_0569185 [Tanacetum coccineum]